MFLFFSILKNTIECLESCFLFFIVLLWICLRMFWQTIFVWIAIVEKPEDSSKHFSPTE